MDYSKLSEIIVKTQEELDAIPDDFKGRIYINGGTSLARIYIKKKYYYSVVARGNSSVAAWDNSSVAAWETAPLWRGTTAPLRRGTTAPLWRGKTAPLWRMQMCK